MATEVPDPIINSPYIEPEHHWQIEHGAVPVKAEGRRPAYYYYRVPEGAGTGRGGRQQQDMLGDIDVGEREELGQVNLIRQKVREWREGRITGVPYDGISRVTRELLELWQREDRAQRLFFAQIEAAETVIFLVEGNKVYHKGLTEVPRDEPGATAKDKGFRSFLRYASKMATGTGKTTVMGMLAAWSILNRVASPTDDRFSDTVLIVCPNVTIRERLKELDPLLGDLSLYRTRQLVPPQRMEELRRGEVMIANWHRLAKHETNSVNGVSSKVVKTGEAVETVKQSGKDKGKVEVRYFESDQAWFKRIRQELGSGRGRSPHWLVFNDEAHHAYRRGDTDKDESSLEEDATLAKKNAREATIWIEGLDRINKLANGNKRGINLCVDLSATPFYIQGSGNEVGRPFPWIVSDFGLLDAIESGLVKIPELPTADAAGEEEAAYFNIWRWVQDKAEKDGHGKNVTPELVMTYASRPITLLAADWHKHFERWQQVMRDRQRYPVPPVFIVVCRDTKVAKEVYSWLAFNEGGYGESPQWFRNEPGRELTVRVDSKVAEDMEAGGGSDEVKRMRFILDTIGKPEWPGGKVPAEWSELVRKHNDKLSSQDDEEDAEEEKGHWLDERIPPGRDIRCIVSVSMLAEGWDANTVTHIVGLRPFGSQLLCEQVIGRALRRQSYTVDDKTKLFTEETAKVFGVPFELVPFKKRPVGDPVTPKDVHHIYSVPEKEDKYRIDFPVVTGYQEVDSLEIDINWSQVAQVTIDPKEIPDSVQTGQLTAPDGSLAAFSAGKKDHVTLTEWRALWRDQQVAFVLAREVCKQWVNERGSDVVPMAELFPKVLNATARFLREKLILKSSESRACDVLAAGTYTQAVKGSLFNAIERGAQEKRGLLPVVPKGASGIGSTLYVDFHTTKPVRAVSKCHLNLMVADTKKWEQSAGYLLDKHPGVVKWVKNDRLGFHIPYRHNNISHRYEPDFIVELDTGMRLIIETKGQYLDDSDRKAKAAERWVQAVNFDGRFGVWHYVVVTDPTAVLKELDALCSASIPNNHLELQ